MYDGYPKSSGGHFLILPLPPIPSLTSLTPDHLPLLEALQSVSLSLSSHVSPSTVPLIGVHAVPSLRPLHIHVLPTSSLDGPSLRKPSHALSFSTPFLVPLAAVANHLRAAIVGCGVRVREEAAGRLCGGDLVCHKCGDFRIGRGEGTVNGRVGRWVEHQKECRGERRQAEVSSLLAWEGLGDYFEGRGRKRARNL